MKQTLSSFFGIFFAITAVFLYPIVSNAETCEKQPASEASHANGAWWLDMSDGDILYCGNGQKYGCSYNQVVFDGKDFAECRDSIPDRWVWFAPINMTKCNENMDFSGYKSVGIKDDIMYYKEGNKPYMVKTGTLCKIERVKIKDKCENSGGNFDSNNKCNCFKKELDKKTLSCKEPVKQEPEKSNEQKACENTKGTWANNACSCSGNYYTNDNKTCIEKKSGEPCSASDLAKITGAASGTYNSNLKCVLKSCKTGLEEVVKDGKKQGWCNKPQAQNNSETQGGTVGNWWTLLVGSIK